MNLELNKGVILQYICKSQMPPFDFKIQVLGTRKINSDASNFIKYRVAFSDGQKRFSQAVFMLDNDDQVPPDNAIIKVSKNSSNSLKIVGEKLVFVISDFEVIKMKHDGIIGNPVPLNPEDYEIGPSTPSSSKDNENPPPLPSKRTHDPDTPPQDNKAKQARRNLFAARTTHCIKDLNPYQNKYTVQGRVMKKSDKKTWSNSRGQGQVFDFIIQDASGDIKVTAFNDEVDRFFDLIKEGEIFYLSNAKIQPVRKPEYNNTKHTYELSLMSHSIIEACKDKNSNQAIPSIEYNFVKIKDIQQVSQFFSRICYLKFSVIISVTQL